MDCRHGECGRGEDGGHVYVRPGTRYPRVQPLCDVRLSPKPMVAHSLCGVATYGTIRRGRHQLRAMSSRQGWAMQQDRFQFGLFLRTIHNRNVVAVGQKGHYALARGRRIRQQL